MTTVALYERVEALRVIDSWIEENAEAIAAADWALPPELEALLNEAEGAFDEKVERVALYVRSLAATCDAIKTEEDRLATRRRAMVRASDGLKGYLQSQMEAVGKTQVKRPLATVAIQESPPSVQSTLDEAALRNVAQYAPECVTRIPEQWKLDSRAVLAWHKAGHELPDGVTVTRGTHLRIR